MKQCSICGAEKDESDFYVRKKATGALFGWCKKCHSQRCKETYLAKHEEKKAKCREYMEKQRNENPEKFRLRTAEWRAKNPEKVKETSRKAEAKRRDKKKAYREANKDKIKAQQAEYRAVNKDRINAYNAAYRLANKEVLAERQRQWRMANPADYAEIHRRWKQANKAKVNAYTHKRCVLLAGTQGENYTPEQWEELKRQQDYTCLCCGRREPEIQLTVDHVKAVSRGGSNDIANIMGLCKKCNCGKHTKEVDYRSAATSV